MRRERRVVVRRKAERVVAIGAAFKVFSPPVLRKVQGVDTLKEGIIGNIQFRVRE